MVRNGIIFIVFSLVGIFSLNAKSRTTVAIVCDTATLNRVENQIEAYAESIRDDGKECTVIADIWCRPDSIRARLEKMYNETDLEGAILIGDIPVAMIRDAQHLTTAFKMDQARPMFESSVPSDRFYDDFGLRFDYLGQDGEHPLLHYYSLRADSQQFIDCDIYSARIKAPDMPGKTRYESIAGLLEKIVREKGRPRDISGIFYFAGHGYNSESLQARVDETRALVKHFPRLEGKGRISFINYDRDDFVKRRFQAALEDGDTDIALLHHHGAEDTQYLSATPYVNSVGGYISYLKRFMRSKIRSARDTASARQYYVDNYGVPESWTYGASDPALTAEDDAFSGAMDVTIKDTYGRKSGPRFIMHDACFNGSFHLDDYIAGHYLFNPGSTVAVKANSVNTLQDTWPLELIGLLDEGVCIGNWLKNTMTLESHILGDPTYRFTHSSGSKGNPDTDIVLQRNNARFWKKELENQTGDRKALAISMLGRLDGISPETLLDIQANDQDPIVRLEAFSTIRKYHMHVITEAIAAGLEDSYELHARLAALTAAKNGAPELLPVLASLYFDPTTSDRVEFQIRSALEQYSYAEIEKVFGKMREEHPSWPSEQSYRALMSSLERNEKASEEDFMKLHDDSLTFRKRRLTVSSQKNRCLMKHVDGMLEYLSSGNDPDMRLLITETLGWYVYSPAEEKIVSYLEKNMETEKDARVKSEMLKSINRLEPERHRTPDRTQKHR